MSIDDKIERKRTELLKLRENLVKEHDVNEAKIAELKGKKAMLALKIKQVLEKGTELSVYCETMKKVNDLHKFPYDSIGFGHQVLLLHTIHQMECREATVRLCASQGMNLVKFVERRKRVLREQNGTNELEFANKLGQQFQKIKEMEEQYRQILQGQQKMLWKLETSAFPLGIEMPPLPPPAASDYLRDHVANGKSSKMANSSIMREEQCRATSMRNLMEIDEALNGQKSGFSGKAKNSRKLEEQRRGKSMRNLMEIDEALNGPRAPEDLSMSSLPSQIEFQIELNDKEASGEIGKGRRRFKGDDSTNTLSTAGEELFNSIQGYLFGRRNSKDQIEIKGGNSSLDDSDEDWMSNRGQ